MDFTLTWKKISDTLGHKGAICVFAVPLAENNWDLRIGKVADKEDFVKEFPSCNQWALLIDVPKTKKVKKSNKAE